MPCTTPALLVYTDGAPLVRMVWCIIGSLVSRDNHTCTGCLQAWLRPSYEDDECSRIAGIEDMAFLSRLPDLFPRCETGLNHNERTRGCFGVNTLLSYVSLAKETQEESR